LPEVLPTDHWGWVMVQTQKTVVLPSEEDMTAGLRALSTIAVTLGKINRRLGKYLIDIAPPTDVELQSAALGAPEPYLAEVPCMHCFTPLMWPVPSVTCDHGWLCPACAPCDECESTKEEGS